MLIAISSAGADLNADLDPRFGRATGFIVYDTITGNFTSIDNEPNKNSVQGAGIQAAKTLFDHNVDAVITGHCGPKAFQALKNVGIMVALCSVVSVEESIRRYKNGELETIDDANVDTHWS